MIIDLFKADQIHIYVRKEIYQLQNLLTANSNQPE